MFVRANGCCLVLPLLLFCQEDCHFGWGATSAHSCPPERRQCRRPCCPHRYALSLSSSQAFSLACWVNEWLIIMDDRHGRVGVSRKVGGLSPDVKVDLSLTPRPGHVSNDSYTPATMIRNVIYQKIIWNIGLQLGCNLLKRCSIIKHTWCGKVHTPKTV